MTPAPHSLRVEHLHEPLAITVPAPRPSWRIEVGWRLTPGKLVVDVTVPSGTTAEIVLPDGSSRDAEPGAHTFESEV